MTRHLSSSRVIPRENSTKSSGRHSPAFRGRLTIGTIAALTTLLSADASAPLVSMYPASTVPGTTAANDARAVERAFGSRPAPLARSWACGTTRAHAIAAPTWRVSGTPPGPNSPPATFSGETSTVAQMLDSQLLYRSRRRRPATALERHDDWLLRREARDIRERARRWDCRLPRLGGRLPVRLGAAFPNCTYLYSATSSTCCSSGGANRQPTPTPTTSAPTPTLTPTPAPTSTQSDHAATPPPGKHLAAGRNAGRDHPYAAVRLHGDRRQHGHRCPRHQRHDHDRRIQRDDLPCRIHGSGEYGVYVQSGSVKITATDRHRIQQLASPAAITPLTASRSTGWLADMASSWAVTCSFRTPGATT